MMGDRDPLDRLSSAYRIEVDPETTERHLAELGVAIRTATPIPIPAGFGLRRRIAAAAAAILVLAPAGMALAAESAVPGDFLYPVKEITERVRAVVDGDIKATHRVEEVERLVFRRAPHHEVTRAVERAESATMQLAESDDLRFRLERARELLQLQGEEQPVVEGDEPGVGRQESGTDTGKTNSGEGAGTTVPAKSGESSGQDQQGSGTTGTTTGQTETAPGSGEGAGSMTDSDGAPTSTAPQESGGSSRP